MEDDHSSSSMSDSSYQNIQPHTVCDSDDLDSLPSTSATSTELSPSEAEAESDAEREWKESLQQLELLLTMVLMPYIGKYFGRKAAYWGKKEWHESIELETDLYRLGQVHGMELPCED